MEGQRVLKWNFNYTHVEIVNNPDGPPDRKCKIIINREDNPYILVSNVKYSHDGVTVFGLFGSVFIGGTSDLNLKIYDYPNGVRQAELTVVKIQD